MQVLKKTLYLYLTALLHSLMSLIDVLPTREHNYIATLNYIK